MAWCLAILQLLAKSSAEIKEVQRLQGAISLRGLQSKIRFDDSHSLEKVISISEEPNREMFFRNLLIFARELRSRDCDSQEASAILQMLDRSEVVDSVRQEARNDLEAMAGRGSAGRRVGYLTERLVHEATHYRTIAPVLAGSMVYQIARTAALGRLAATARITPWTRGSGAQLAAGTLGFFAEVPIFALSSRYLNHLSGLPVRESALEDLGTAGITLGFLKVFGALGQGLFNRVPHQGLAGTTRFAKATPHLRGLVSQSSQFFGILAAYRVEEKLGLRPSTDEDTLVTDALASLLSFSIGIHAASRALGPGFQRFQSELAIRAETSGSPARNQGIAWKNGFSDLTPLAMAMDGGSVKPSAHVQKTSPLIIRSSGSGARKAPAWRATREDLQSTLEYVLKNHLEGDPERINCFSFIQSQFTLPDGSTLRGRDLVMAAAQIEKPGLPQLQAVADLGGTKKVIDLIKQSYLGLRAPNETWDKTPESLGETLEFIWGNQLEQHSKVANSPGFLNRQFPLRDGNTVSGYQILSAVAHFERPDLPRGKAVNEIGRKNLIRILKQKYLHQPVPDESWCQSEAALSAALQSILEREMKGDISRISSSKHFRRRSFALPDGTRVSGDQIIDAVVLLEKPGMKEDEGIAALGGIAKVLELLKEKYLKKIDWRNSAEGLTSVARYILQHHLNNDASRINTGPGLVEAEYSLADGRRVKGRDLLNAVARLEKPGMDLSEAFAALGGKSQAMELLKNKYLRAQDWDDSIENVKAAARHILTKHLQNDPDRITTDTRGEFIPAIFPLTDGAEITGLQLLNAVARLENPGVPTLEAVQALGGGRRVLDILKSKYLEIDLPDESWGKSLEGLKAAVAFILTNELKGDPREFSPGGIYTLADGTQVRGQRIVDAMARLEKPDLSGRKAVQEMGGSSKVFERFAKEHLQAEWVEDKWSVDSAALTAAIQYILKTYLNRDASKMNADSRGAFLPGKFSLPEGGTVTGWQLVHAAARFERPGLPANKAIVELGGVANIIKILKDKYLGGSLPPWNRDADCVTAALSHILRVHLENDPTQINSQATFLIRIFPLPGGQEASGWQILRAVAGMEHPELPVMEAMRKLGGKEGVVELILKKYLGIDLENAFTSQELEKVKEEIALEGLTALGPSSRNLADYLELAYGKGINGEQIQGMVRAFTGLGLQTEIHEGPPQNPLDWGDRVIRALFLKRAKFGGIANEDWNRILQLYLRLVQRTFTSQFELSFKALEEKFEKEESPDFKELYRRAIEYFRVLQTRADEELVLLKTEPFTYQKDGALFIIDNPKAMILDDPGLGKGLEALLATETLIQQKKIKKVLIVCPATVRSVWKKEIAKHLPRKPVVVTIAGNVKQKRDLIKASEQAEYVIANFEFFRNKKVEAIQEILSGLDMLIIDEAQNFSNPSDRIQQAEAIRQISAPRTLLLTATPYYSKVVWIYSLLKYLFPENPEYADQKVFHENYAKDPRGLYRLHQDLQIISRRREKEEVFGRFKSGEAANGQWKLPEQKRIPYQEEGRYVLSDEQVELLAWISQDPKGWRRWFERQDERTPTHSKMTHFTHLQYLYAASLDARLVGGKGISPLFAELDRIVEKRMNQDKKIILYAHHRRVLNHLMRHFQDKYGDGTILRLDGSVKGSFQRENGVKVDRREDVTDRFQEDPQVRILAANMQVGGVGLTLTAADSLIFVEKPLSFSTYYQSLNRADRIDLGRNKTQVEIISMVSAYPEGAAERFPNENLAEFFGNDSVPQILEERLEGMERVYRLVMDGRVTQEAAQKELKQQLVSGLKGVRFEDRLPQRKIQQKEQRRLEAVEHFAPLFEHFSENPTVQDQIVHLAREFSLTSLDPAPLIQVLLTRAATHPETPWVGELKWAATPFLIKSKYTRDIILQRLPELLKKIYGATNLTSLVEGIRAEDRPSLSKLYLPAFMAFQLHQTPSLVSRVRVLLDQIARVSDRGLQKRLVNRLTIALTRLSDWEDNSFIAFFTKHADFFLDRSQPVERRLGLIERLALLKRTYPPLADEFFTMEFGDMAVIETFLDEIYLDGIFSLLKLKSTPELKRSAADLHREWGDLDPLYAVLGGMLRDPEPYQEEVQVFREAIEHLLKGDFSAWRRQEIPRTSAKPIDYLKGATSFWGPWNQPSTSDFPRVEFSKSKGQKQLEKLAEKVKAHFFSKSAKKIGDPWIKEKMLQFFESTRPEAMMNSLLQDQKALGNLVQEISKNKKYRWSPQEETLFGLYSAFGESRSRVGIYTVLKRMKALTEWMEIFQGLEQYLHGNGQLPAQSIAAKLYKRLRHQQKLSGSRKFLDVLETLANWVEAYSGEKVYEDVRVFDTDDPFYLLRRGGLTDQLINCFQIHGDPFQVKTLASDLASMSRRLLIVEANGRIVGAAMAKIMQRPDGQPTIHLETSLFERGGYSFEREMLEHLNEKKRLRMVPVPWVTQDMQRDKKAPQQTEVRSIGAATRKEYSEALFRPEETEWIVHPGKVVWMGK